MSEVQVVNDKVAVVLAGAGARGAFEAGGLAGVWPHLTATGRRPTIFTGASAGSINSVLAASVAHLPPEQAAAQLTDQWNGFLTSIIRSVGLAWPATGLRYLAGRLHLPVPPVSLLDPPSLREILGRWNGWDDLHRNVETGVVDAVVIMVTDVTNDRSIAYVETQDDRPLPEDDLERGIHYVRTKLGLEHVYASSCIPLISPPVELDDEDGNPTWNVDGGVRLNVPLKPALDFGANRLVVIATDTASRPQAASDGGVPTTFDLVDSLLHLATGDRLLEDLRRLTQVNELLDEGAAGQSQYRKVPALIVAPAGANDIADLVRDTLASGPGRVLLPAIQLLSRITGLPGESVPDLATFLLFLPFFTRRAVELGRTRAAEVLAQGRDGWQERHADFTLGAGHPSPASRPALIEVP